MASAQPAPHPAMIQMEGRIDLMNQRLESSIQAMSGDISALGAEVHTLRTLLESGQALLMEKMAEVSTTSMHLRLLTESIREHNDLEKRRQETTDRALTELRDKESTARGERRGAAFVLTLLVALVGYIYVSDKQQQAEINLQFSNQLTANRAMLLTHEEQLKHVPGNTP